MTSANKNHFIDAALKKRRKEHRFRDLSAYKPKEATVLFDGDRDLTNFSGNDYLGLSKHPEVLTRSKTYADEFGAGSTASRLINGTYSIHQQLEQKLAETFGWEAAMIFNSGFQANSTIIGTLTDRHSLILADKLSHNSILQGSLSSRATFRRFEHNSVEDLENQLEKAAKEDFNRIFVVTESLFSMDGDKTDLQEVAKLTKQYNAWLFVDDAHAVGAWGEQGLGLTHGTNGIDMVLGTCGKAFGGFGAFLLCSDKVKDYLVNFCPGFIYTTALPPAVIGAIEASLELIPSLDSRRKRLYQHIKTMQKGINDAGFSTGNSDSQIIPILIGKEQKTLDLARKLEKKGFLATAIRPPTVPQRSSRIRITLSSEHTEQQIESFLTALNNWNNG